VVRESTDPTGKKLVALDLDLEGTEGKRHGLLPRRFVWRSSPQETNTWGKLARSARILELEKGNSRAREKKLRRSIRKMRGASWVLSPRYSEGVAIKVEDKGKLPNAVTLIRTEGNVGP